jgi:crossover junction endodeoxyribonuclease RuvC
MIIGIDPGKSGGVAAVSDRGVLWAGIRTPLLKHGKRDVVDTSKLTRWVLELAELDKDGGMMFAIEQVSAMPGQGVTSMFNFGRHTGAVEGWAVGWGVPVVWVTPQVWKKSYGLSKDKRASLDRARLEFGSDPRWDVLANDGIAEAALIALWSLKTRRDLD